MPRITLDRREQMRDRIIATAKQVQNLGLRLTNRGLARLAQVSRSIVDVARNGNDLAEFVENGSIVFLAHGQRENEEPDAEETAKVMIVEHVLEALAIPGLDGDERASLAETARQVIEAQWCDSRYPAFMKRIIMQVMPHAQDLVRSNSKHSELQASVQRSDDALAHEKERNDKLEQTIRKQQDMIEKKEEHINRLENMLEQAMKFLPKAA